MIVVVAALKGGVGKTTTSVYLAAVAASNKRSATLVDADPQGSAADWVETAEDESFERVTLVEAPTERMLTKALSRGELPFSALRELTRVAVPRTERAWLERAQGKTLRNQFTDDQRKVCNDQNDDP